MGFQPFRKTRTATLNTVRIIFQRIADIVRDIKQMPHAIVSAVREYREENVRAEVEAERLDRIRNPFKYRGK